MPGLQVMSPEVAFLHGSILHQEHESEVLIGTPLRLLHQPDLIPFGGGLTMKVKLIALTVIPVTVVALFVSTPRVGARKANDSFNGLLRTQDFYKGRSHQPWTV